MTIAVRGISKNLKLCSKNKSSTLRNLFSGRRSRVLLWKLTQVLWSFSLCLLHSLAVIFFYMLFNTWINMWLLKAEVVNLRYTGYRYIEIKYWLFSEEEKKYPCKSGMFSRQINSRNWNFVTWKSSFSFQYGVTGIPTQWFGNFVMWRLGAERSFNINIFSGKGTNHLPSHSGGSAGQASL